MTGNEISLAVDGVPVTNSIVSISAFYSCRQRFGVSVQSNKLNVTSNLFSIRAMPNGGALYSEFMDKTGSFNKVYRTADFISFSTLTVASIRFIEDEKLDIVFSGSLLKLMDALSALE